MLCKIKKPRMKQGRFPRRHIKYGKEQYLARNFDQFALAGVDDYFWNLFFSSPLRHYCNPNGVTYFSFEMNASSDREINAYILVSFTFALSEQALEEFSLCDDLNELFNQEQRFFAHVVSKYVFFDNSLKEMGIEPGKYPRKARLCELNFYGRKILLLLPEYTFKYARMALTQVIENSEDKFDPEGIVLLSNMSMDYSERTYVIGLRPVSVPIARPLSTEQMLGIPFSDEVTVN